MSRVPQKEHGYTPVAHKILEEIGRHGLNGTQRGIIDQVWRYTYGFDRKGHALSIGFIATALDKSKSHVDRELTALIERNVIQVVSEGSSRGRVLRFNKYFDSWLDRQKKDSSIEETDPEGDVGMANVPYKEIIDHLNAKAGTRYSHKSKPTQKNINGRFSEGRTLEDFQHVIDVKCVHWLGDQKMEQYLRPSTLFSPKNFENYLNQTADTGKGKKPSTFDQNQDLIRRKMEEAKQRESDGSSEDNSADFDSLPEP